MINGTATVKTKNTCETIWDVFSCLKVVKHIARLGSNVILANPAGQEIDTRLSMIIPSAATMKRVDFLLKILLYSL